MFRYAAIAAGALVGLAPRTCAADEDTSSNPAVALSMGVVQLASFAWEVHAMAMAQSGHGMPTALAATEGITSAIGCAWTTEWLTLTQIRSVVRPGARRQLSPLMRGLTTAPMVMSTAATMHGFVSWLGENELSPAADVKLAAAAGLTIPFTAMTINGMIFGGWQEPAVAVPALFLSLGAGVLSAHGWLADEEGSDVYAFIAGLAVLNEAHAVASLALYDESEEERTDRLVVTTIPVPGGAGLGLGARF